MRFEMGMGRGSLANGGRCVRRPAGRASRRLLVAHAQSQALLLFPGTALRERCPGSGWWWCSGRGAARTCMRSPWLPCTLRISTGSIAGRAEPVRCPRVELGDLAGPHDDVVLAQDQPHLAGEHVQPLVARVGPQPAFALGRDHDLPDRHRARLPGQRVHEPAVAGLGLRPDPRVADPRRADELVQRQVERLGQRQQQLQAGLALAVLQARERALGDPGPRGQRRSASGRAARAAAAAAGRPRPARPGSPRVGHGGDATGVSRKRQRTLPNAPADGAR